MVESMKGETMIKCNSCGKDFPKPTTRGRPPKRCPECRADAVIAETLGKPASANTEAATGRRWHARCHKCNTGWDSLAHAHCSLCHRHFTSVSGADRHRDFVKVLCHDPATMRAGKDRKPIFKLVDRANASVPVWAFANEVEWWKGDKKNEDDE